MGKAKKRGSAGGAGAAGEAVARAPSFEIKKGIFQAQQEKKESSLLQGLSSITVGEKVSVIGGAGDMKKKKRRSGAAIGKRNRQVVRNTKAEANVEKLEAKREKSLIAKAKKDRAKNLY